MALFNDIYCQICDRFYTKQRRNKHLYSSRHLYKKVYGYWPACLPQRTLICDEGIELEKRFWEKIFGSVDVLQVYGFLETHIMMVTIMKDNVTLDRDDDDDDGFRYIYRDTMIAQFKQDLYNKNFSFQDQCKDVEIDTLENRNKLLFKIIDDTGGPMPDDIYTYDYNDEGMDRSVRGAEVFPEIIEFKKLFDILR